MWVNKSRVERCSPPFIVQSFYSITSQLWRKMTGGAHAEHKRSTHFLKNKKQNRVLKHVN